MIYSVSGKLLHTQPDMAVIECGGIGYQCLTTLSTLSRLPAVGEKATLYTYLQVREDAISLFGFYDRGELSCFKMLISVSGVGPKAALSILSNMTPEKFALCVATNDIKSITKAPGVGNKLAQRIVLELKDKIKNDDVAKGISGAPVQLAPAGSTAGEAIDALVVLGYSQAEAASAIAGLDPSLPVEKLITGALRALSSPAI